MTRQTEIKKFRTLNLTISKKLDKQNLIAASKVSRLRSRREKRQRRMEIRLKQWFKNLKRIG